MIPTTQAVIDAIDQSSRTFRARFLTSLSPLTVLQCSMMSLTVYTGGGGARPVPGAVFCSYLEASVRDLVSPIKGQELYLQLGVVTGYDGNGDEVIGWLPSNGKYTVNKTSVSGAVTAFTGVGDITAKCQDKYVTALTFPDTISNVLSEIATRTGATINASDFTLTGEIEFTPEGTYAEVLGMIAGLLGAFVTEDYQGDIVFKAFGSGDVYGIDLSRVTTNPVITEDPFVITGITVQVNETYYYSHGTPNVVLTNKWMTQDLFDDMYPQYEGYTFSPTLLALALGNPRLEPQDIVEITLSDNTTVEVPCHQITTHFTGAVWQEISSQLDGMSDDEVEQVKGAIAERLDQVVEEANNAEDLAEQALQSAEATRQYFWFTGTGTDTGAHITEVPRAKFTDPTDPDYQSGGNLLARSNGIAVREGMKELATMSQDGFDAKTYDDIGNEVVIAHLGYGEGTDSGGSLNKAPYYDIGLRLSGSTKGNYSVAEGANTTSSGYGSHAEGLLTKATTTGAHAEGDNVTASGIDSHAEGTATLASGRQAHAEGDYTEATGDWGAHAEGYYTKAAGRYSHSQNYRTEAGYDYQTVIGKYNNNKSTSLFEVGNGTADNARSNAFEVTLTGDVTAGGDATIGGDIAVGGHTTPIGTNDTTTNTTATRGNSTSYAGIGLQVSLPKGVWMLTGTITFASNTTGRRAVRLTDAGTAIACSEVVSPPANGAATALHTSAVVENTTSSNKTYAMQCYQNSGSTQNVTGELRYVRIA